MFRRSTDTQMGQLRPRGANTQDLLEKVWLMWSRKGLASVSFAPPSTDEELQSVPKEFARPFEAYLGGKKETFSEMPLDVDGSEFQHRVWNALAEVPYGQIATYSDIAARIGDPSAVRAVGNANGKNPVPIVVPCHRIVRSDGSLGGYSAGLDYKTRLLALEGITVIDGKVNANVQSQPLTVALSPVEFLRSQG